MFSVTIVIFDILVLELLLYVTQDCTVSAFSFVLNEPFSFSPPGGENAETVCNLYICV